MVLILLVGSTPASAQIAAVSTDTVLGDTLLIDSRFAGPVDSFRLRLEKGGQYRIAVWPSRAQITASGKQAWAAAYVTRVSEGSGGRPTLIELYPANSEQHLLVVTIPVHADTGRVQVWSDRKLAHQHQEQRDREWGIGLSLSGEFHSGYVAGPEDSSSSTSGTGVGGCILVGSSGPLSACLGFDYQPRSSDAGSMTWYFLEPRVRALTAHPGGHPLDVLVSLRIGKGGASRVYLDPSIIAPGLIASWHLDSRPGARGWRLNFQLTQAWASYTRAWTQESISSGFTEGSLGVSWIP